MNNTHNMPMGHIHDDGPQPLDQAMLRKYIAYARANVKPILHDLDTEKVSDIAVFCRLSRSFCGLSSQQYPFKFFDFFNA